MSSTSRFFATASRGTERILADELRALGVPRVEERRGGVELEGSLADAYRACLWSRVASRVLLPLSEFEVDGADALYEGVAAIDWTSHVRRNKTLAVDVAGGNSPAGPPQFVVLKTKDAIVDHLRSAIGTRPDVDRANPDLKVNVHLSGTRVTVSLDLAGGSLHRRGIERAGGVAPLKENLAAAILLMAGWADRAAGGQLYDPFCGSGTFLIEAAWIACDVAPGLGRGRIGAEGWSGHDAMTWQRLREEAKERRQAGLRRPVRIAGSDASAGAIDDARRNLERSGLGRLVRLATVKLRNVEAPDGPAGVFVANPPYGARLGDAGELSPLYELLGDVLKRRFNGWQAWILCGEPRLGKRVGLRPAARHVLYNGPIECRLLELPIGAKPVSSGGGPGWRRPSKEAGALGRRLGKNRRELAGWARRNRLTCYRLYDADLPEYNLSVDWYDGAVRIVEHPRPRKVDESDAERHLRDAMLIVPEVLGIKPEEVVLSSGRAKSADGGREDDPAELRVVREGDLRFQVHLRGSSTPGLAPDARALRRRFFEDSRKGKFLSLFAGPCTAAVAAAAGGAATTSVDRSKRHLAWGRRNFALNGIELSPHRFLDTDVVEWLDRGGDRRRYDTILLEPVDSAPKTSARGLDVQRDHVWLIMRSLRMLTPGGVVVLTSRQKRFELDEKRLKGLSVRAITTEITTRDCARRPTLRVWEMRPGPRGRVR